MAQKDEIDQLVGDEADTIIENCIKIESALAQALENVGQVGTSAAEYGSTLTRLSGEIDEDFSASEVRSFVSKLFSETQRMCERNRNLEAKLRESSGEINKLQENLANARIEALTDGLTGVANRKSFDSKLKALIVEGAEAGDRMSLLMIDIDHFKNFNDTHGHQLGDQVLKLVAHVLTQGVKGRDMVARYGGEEFSIILGQTRLIDAVTVADKLRESVASSKIVRKDSGENLGVITLSIGVAMHRSGEEPNVLIERADQALYAAKNQGRNRVVSEETLRPARLSA